MSYNTRYKSKQIADKLAALRNIDSGLSGESGEESDTDEIPTEEDESSERSDDDSEDSGEESEGEQQDNQDSNTEISADGTVWLKSTLSDPSFQKRVGRASAQSIIKVIPGPTPFAKRNIGSILTAFSNRSVGISLGTIN